MGEEEDPQLAKAAYMARMGRLKMLKMSAAKNPEMLLGCALNLKGFGKCVAVGYSGADGSSSGVGAAGSGGGAGGGGGAAAGRRRYSLYKKATVKHTLVFAQVRAALGRRD